MAEFRYVVTLEIANDKARETFDLKTIEKKIEEAIKQYHALDTVRNKKVLSAHVEKETIEMTIVSPVQLEVPSKALAKFTRLLVALSPELEATITNKRVFQSVRTNIPASEIDRISTCDTLKKMVDLFCGELQSDEKLELQRKIKCLLFNRETETD
jgi:hypothetical protein